jgi:hypothetical protein
MQRKFRGTQEVQLEPGDLLVRQLSHGKHDVIADCLNEARTDVRVVVNPAAAIIYNRITYYEAKCSCGWTVGAWADKVGRR